MDREQTKALVKKIKTIYQNKFFIEDPKELVDTWHEILKDYDFNNVMGQLNNYVKFNKFAPSVSELIPTQVSKYPGHSQADDLLKKVDDFKKEKSGPPPNVNIRDILRG